MKKMEKRTYEIIERKQETYDVVTLKFKKSFSYVPGQFITVYFLETGTPEGKSYSLSSAPHEDYASITVKAMGEFSNRLCALRPGQTILASPPYGFFWSESTDSDIVLLSSGVGIAPFRSMALDSIARNSDRKILLFHSVRTRADILFKKEFESIPHTYFITREEQRERMKPKQIIESLQDLNEPEFFLCGSISFVREMWIGLRENGVPEEVIYTEAFFSH